MDQGYQYDLFVIGGGSGGQASSKAAARLGKKVGLADFVKPTPIGTTWGIGGTCVNVGCVPKKLMHYAALIGEQRHELKECGWEGIDLNGNHNWAKLVESVQKYILRLNTLYKQFAENAGVVYYNKLGRLIDKHTVELTALDGSIETVTAQTIIIAVGTRPTFLKNIDPKHVITSDDIFKLDHTPGKTLVVGASYVALECAGFLRGLGYDVTIMVRSILLRGFDQEMANRIGKYMEDNCGIKFIKGFVPESLEVLENGKRLVKWDGGKSEEFDTVLLAIGRTADTKNLNLEAVGVRVNLENQKIICNEADQTDVDNIYAVGDAVQGRLELTPTAVMCGRRLIKRLYQGETELMSYEDVATTVFTPLEYGTIGLSEEKAIEKFGKENVRVFTTSFKPLIWNFNAKRDPKASYGKLVVHIPTDKVVGLHYIGPDAAEVTQGFGVAIKMGATKKQFDNTVGIHPSLAEELVQMTTIKST